MPGGERVGTVRRLLRFSLLFVIQCCLLSVIGLRCRAPEIPSDILETEKFRRQECTETLLDKLCRTPERDRVRLLAASMLMNDYSPDALCGDDLPLRAFRGEEYGAMQRVYEAIWGDAAAFPVGERRVFYEDSWLAPREYGGKRLHEGTDIFGEEDLAGCYPVLSMTDGVVEQIGWLPLGGYRIGIRAVHGGYFYYAHLDSYEHAFRAGERVRAGEVLGYMGNTGYGEEGTSGKFPVHLHLGIYIRTPRDPELSVDPYWVLRYVEKRGGESGKFLKILKISRRNCAILMVACRGRSASASGGLSSTM